MTVKPPGPMIIHCKLRIFLSLKLDLKYLEFFLTYYFGNLQKWSIWKFKHITRISVIKITIKSYTFVSVWKFYLRIFSVYGHGVWFKTNVRTSPGPTSDPAFFVPVTNSIWKKRKTKVLISEKWALANKIPTCILE